MKLVHSKANGKGKVGRCETSEELENVFNAVELQFHIERHLASTVAAAAAVKAASAAAAKPAPPQAARRR